MSTNSSHKKSISVKDKMYGILNFPNPNNGTK